MTEYNDIVMASNAPLQMEHDNNRTRDIAIALNIKHIYIPVISVLRPLGSPFPAHTNEGEREIEDRVCFRQRSFLYLLLYFISFIGISM